MRSFLLLLGVSYAAALSIKRVPEGDWSYHGCYTDSGDRQLGGSNYAAGDMTPDSCISFCNSQGYMFAGIEYASECFCGHTIRSQSVKKEDSECSMACSGDSTKVCGGPDRLSIYINTASTAIITNPGPVGSGWTHTSCFEDSVYARTLAVRIDTASNTVDSCTSACRTAGYKFAGLEWSSECWCDNEILAGKTGGQSGCDMACSGNALEYCGGSQRLNLYSFEAIQSSTTTESSSTSTTTESSSTTTTLSTTSPEPSTTTESSTASSTTTELTTTTTTESSTTTSSSSTTTTPESTTLSTTTVPSTTTTTTVSTTISTTPEPTTTTTTTTTSTTTTTTVAPILPTFALRASNPAIPAVHGKLLLTRPTPGQVLYMITTQTAWVPATFSIEAGTNRLKIGGTQVQYAGTNTGTSIYAATPAQLGSNTWYVGCIGPARLGQPLQCFVETKTKTQWRTSGNTPNIWAALVDPATTPINAASMLIDFIPEYV